MVNEHETSNKKSIESKNLFFPVFANINDKCGGEADYSTEKDIAKVATKLRMGEEVIDNISDSIPTTTQYEDLINKESLSAALTLSTLLNRSRTSTAKENETHQSKTNEDGVHRYNETKKEKRVFSRQVSLISHTSEADTSSISSFRSSSPLLEKAVNKISHKKSLSRGRKSNTSINLSHKDQEYDDKSVSTIMSNTSSEPISKRHKLEDFSDARHVLKYPSTAISSITCADGDREDIPMNTVHPPFSLSQDSTSGIYHPSLIYSNMTTPSKSSPKNIQSTYITTSLPPLQPIQASNQTTSLHPQNTHTSPLPLHRFDPPHLHQPLSTPIQASSIDCDNQSIHHKVTPITQGVKTIANIEQLQSNENHYNSSSDCDKGDMNTKCISTACDAGMQSNESMLTKTSVSMKVRKDKSLGALCRNFLKEYSQLAARFPVEKEYVQNRCMGKPTKKAKRQKKNDQDDGTDDDKLLLSIDQAAKNLGVERRRIYDIINILEAIRVVSRKCKNTYFWHGLESLVTTFQELQEDAINVWREDAIKNGLLEDKDHLKIKEDDSTLAKSEGTTKSSTNDLESTVTPSLDQPSIMSSKIDLILMADASSSNSISGSGKKDCNKAKTTTSNKVGKQPSPVKERSLARLSQKFVQLFLVGNEVIEITDASDKIIGPTDEPKVTNTSNTNKEMKASISRNLKTRIRRLYDVANVLVSVGIIEKLNGGNNMSNAKGERPSFRWVYEITPKQLYESRKKDGHV